MIDSYSQAAIIIRSVALGLFLLVLYYQYLEIKTSKNLQSFKWLLFSLVLLIAVGDIISILLNFRRQADGNLFVKFRQVSTVWGSFSTLAMAIILNSIYRLK